MTTYEFYINNDFDFCCTRSDNPNFVIKNIAAIQKLEYLTQPTIGKARITSRNMIIETPRGSLTLINYKEMQDAKVDLYLDKLISKIKQELPKVQKKKHEKKPVRNKRITGVALVGTLAFTALVSTIREKEKLQATSIIEDLENDFTQNTNTLLMNGLRQGYSYSYKDNTVEVESDTNMTQMENNLVEISHQDANLSDDTAVAYLDFEDERYSVTGESTYSSYYDSVKPYAEKWGLPPNLMVGILTQETAGNYTNLMQVEFNVWKDQILTVYNFNEEKYEMIVLTENPQNYDSDTICITRQDLENPKTNISVGCILFRQSLSYMNYHIGAGIQCYNYGYGNMQQVLDYTAKMTGTSKQEILADQTNLDFMNYTNIVKNQGDSNYLMHVLRYVENIEDGIDIQYINREGEIDNLHVTILPNSKKM
mgnify:CR=1 FL=1